MISTRNLAEMPEPTRLRKLFQSLAMLDAILEPRQSERSILYFAHWSVLDSVGAIRIGDDHLFAAFGPYGAFLKGFVKNCTMGLDGKNWPGMEGSVPRCYQEWLVHP